jgi:hypothetical protein
MILIWKQSGVNRLFKVERTTEGLNGLKARILLDVRDWDMDLSGLFPAKTFHDVQDWVKKNCTGSERFEEFEFSSLLELE